ncbi:MAG: hypothetical protein LBM07_01520 [Culturomica sp.]|nr:hypothetical protein [Culturomica sp.]
MKQFLSNILKLTQYNIKIIFGNKFIYFVLSAVVLFVITSILNLMSNNEFMESTAYNVLLVPSILIIFYPMCFGIQNDQDAKIIEIIFGIPNYRYKVWLFRLLIAYVICFVITFFLAALTNWLLVEISVTELTLQVMVPAFLIGTLSFMFSTIVRNGSGTAVIIIIIGLVFFIWSAFLATSKWNIFINPFDLPSNMNPILFKSLLVDNRLIMLTASVIAMLIGLYKTQEREKYI